MGLNNNNLFINENLTPVNNKIACDCRKLKCNNLISRTYTVNDIGQYKQWETSESTPYEIDHLFVSDFEFHMRNNESVDANNLADESYRSSY